MSAMRSAIAELTAVDPAALTHEETAAEVSEVVHGIQMLQVFLAGLVRSLSDRGGYRSLGYSSPTALLTDLTGMSIGRAREIIGWATIEEKAPHAYSAWADGRLSTDQARQLFRAAETVPDLYPQADQILVDIVEGLDVADTRKAVEYWRQFVEGPGDLDMESQNMRRGLSISRTMNGMRRVDGWLTPTAGEAVGAALQTLTPPRRHDDIRTPRQRRHDALEDLCRDWLDNGVTPTLGGEKPHISLHADLPALQGVAGTLHETEDGDIIDVDTVRMIACDCSLSRIVLGPDSEILDVGRKTRVWTTAQRRAIVARDRHCQGKGCRAQPRHCDIHHKTHWADGGESTIDNGQLLCRPCHTLEHAREKHERRRRSPPTNLGAASYPPSRDRKHP
ncbi:MAG: DUF222 domain-containing protein [Acidimicrobiia bacterium]